MSLHSRILAAHDAADLISLIGLYTQAADQASDLDEACFFLTHAYVYALELGDPRAAGLHARLRSEGREA